LKKSYQYIHNYYIYTEKDSFEVLEDDKCPKSEIVDFDKFECDSKNLIVKKFLPEFNFDQ